jgi:predicted enzyme related to lactoylglutathione lyase
MTETSYFVIQVPDSAQARAFYGGLFGWGFAPGSVSDGFQIQGVTPPAGLRGNADSAVVKVYFDVEDIHEAVTRVRELGGESGEIDESSSGYQVDCRDDQGTEFSLHQQRSAG